MLKLYSWCLVTVSVLWLFLIVHLFSLQCVIVYFLIIVGRQAGRQACILCLSDNVLTWGVLTWGRFDDFIKISKIIFYVSKSYIIDIFIWIS